MATRDDLLGALQALTSIRRQFQGELDALQLQQLLAPPEDAPKFEESVQCYGGLVLQLDRALQHTQQAVKCVVSEIPRIDAYRAELIPGSTTNPGR
mgnify:CR=1 FL=1